MINITQDNFDMNDIEFKKTKQHGTRSTINYALTCKSQSFRLTINNIHIPFGLEQYNGQHIINIELYPATNLEHRNAYEQIKLFENYLETISNTSCIQQLKDDVKNKTYHHNISESKCGVMLRTHIFGKPKVYAIVSGFETELMMSNIKKTTSNIVIDFGIVWITESTYGILWYLREINVIKVK